MIHGLTTSRTAKLIVLVQLLLLLSCYVPPKIPITQDLPKLNIPKARYFIKQARLVQFVDNKSNRLDCTLIGWDDEGFVGIENGAIKKFEYHKLIDVMFVFNQEGDNNSAMQAGAIFGTVASAIIAGAIFSEATHGDHKVPKALTISLLAVAPVTAGLWYLAGRASDPRGYGYESYRFNVDDFMKNPWIWEEAGIK